MGSSNIPTNLQAAVDTLRELPFPELVIVEVCGMCNLKCIMCPSPHLKRKRGMMKWNVYTKIVDEIAKKNPATQLWPAIMGEPLLSDKRIIQCIEYAKEKGVNEVLLNTNATLLTPEVYRELAWVNLDKIIVGLDANSEETYRSIRVGGKFGKIRKNLIEILELKKGMAKAPDIILQFIEMNENRHELDGFREYWLPKGAVLKIRKRLGWGNGVEPHGLDLSPEYRARVPCPWLMRAMNIHWTGNVAQCDADYEGEYSVGNIQTDTIDELWNGEFRRRRARHWEHDFDFMPCRECRDWQAGLSEWYYP